MKVHQIDDNNNQLFFGQLYRQCQETEGVEYLGSLPHRTRPASAFSRGFSLPEYLFGNVIYCRDGGDGQRLPDCGE